MPERKSGNEPLHGVLTPPSRRVPSSTPEGQTVSGAVLAERYQMVALLGRGGTGEVWQAHDMVLDSSVALKLVASTGGETRDGLLNEVRLARSITHPAVCRVFDVGEAEGRIFYSMELIEGETLGTLLKHAGRLTEERVIEIARQLCGGVAAAHARGVLHRGLTPANILVDQKGAIHITDFGIAIARGQCGPQPASQPCYLAPEQLTGGTTETERTDVYAIGLILLELLLGHVPADADAARYAASRASTDPRLERVLRTALAPDPGDRYPSAAAMEQDLSSSSDVRTTSRRWLGVAAAGIALAATLLAGVRWYESRRPAGLTDQDTIVLADFDNATGDPVFDGTLRVATAVALEQSPFMKVFADAAVRNTLRLMARSPDEKITPQVARDIARRESLKAYVSGSISAIGSHYVVTLEAVNAETGDSMAREQVEAPDKEGVLTALGRASSRLRATLGESLPSIAKYDVPLPSATTPSLDALHAYALALDEGRVNLRVEAIPQLKRAIELDPDFAMAYALLSGVYASTGQLSEAPPLARKAYELRNRVSERERYFISWRYLVDAQQAWDRALELASAWTSAYPREAFAFNSLGLSLSTFGEQERAVEAFRHAMELDARFVPPHRNLADSLVALNRFEDARRVLAASEAAGVSSVGSRHTMRTVALVLGDEPAVAAPLPDSSPEERMWTTSLHGEFAAFSGQLEEAHRLFQESSQAAIGARVPALAARWNLQDAEAHAVTNDCDAARRSVTSAVALARDSAALGRAGRVLALCGAPGEAEQVSTELLERFPDATLTARIDRPVIAAAIALRRGELDRVGQLLEPVRPYDNAPMAQFWPAYLRGEALRRQERGTAALAEFQSILDHRGVAPLSPLYPLARLGAARALVLVGRSDEARAAYIAFRSGWSDADAGLAPRREALTEIDRLR